MSDAATPLANPMDLTGRSILVTGAGQGVGKSTAELLIALGANVILLDARPDTLQATAGAFPPDRVLVACGSVTDSAFVQASVDAAAGRFGGVHGLVNNAGVTRTGMIENMAEDAWQTVLDVNLTGAFLCLKSVGLDMVRRAKAGEPDPGSIVNISSDAGLRGTVGQINYSAAKAGLLGLTMSAAREWGRYGIRVNTVGFGVVETQMTEVIRGEKFRERYLSNIPMGRFLAPDEAARAICFLLSPAATFITGQHLSVNGGSHMSA